MPRFQYLRHIRAKWHRARDADIYMPEKIGLDDYFEDDNHRSKVAITPQDVLDMVSSAKSCAVEFRYFIITAARGQTRVIHFPDDRNFERVTFFQCVFNIDKIVIKNQGAEDTLSGATELVIDRCNNVHTLDISDCCCTDINIVIGVHEDTKPLNSLVNKRCKYLTIKDPDIEKRNPPVPVDIMSTMMVTQRSDMYVRYSFDLMVIPENITFESHDKINFLILENLVDENIDFVKNIKTLTYLHIGFHDDVKVDHEYIKDMLYYMHFIHGDVLVEVDIIASDIFFMDYSYFVITKLLSDKITPESSADVCTLDKCGCGMLCCELLSSTAILTAEMDHDIECYAYHFRCFRRMHIDNHTCPFLESLDDKYKRDLLFIYDVISYEDERYLAETADSESIELLDDDQDDISDNESNVKEHQDQDDISDNESNVKEHQDQDDISDNESNVKEHQDQDDISDNES
ncbi:MAG: hypothetical protein KDH96_11750, partial [Candidatus Riesia sp.]|nr:hypothetical protein [Candidatus Riesia sp.]